jgi:hypothetical protein
MRRLVGCTLVAVLALIAVAAPASATASGSTPMATAKVKGAGVSVKYPRAWIVVPLTKQALAAEMKIIAGKNPKLAALMSSVDPSQSKFFAIDPATYSSEQVQFSPGSGGPANLGEFKQGVKQIYASTGATFLDAEAVKVGGKTAYRAHLSLPIKAPDGTTVEVREGQLFLVHGDDGTVVTVGVRSGGDTSIIDTILSGVHRV